MVLAAAGCTTVKTVSGNDPAASANSAEAVSTQVEAAIGNALGNNVQWNTNGGPNLYGAYDQDFGFITDAAGNEQGINAIDVGYYRSADLASQHAGDLMGANSAVYTDGPIVVTVSDSAPPDVAQAVSHVQGLKRVSS